MRRFNISDFRRALDEAEAWGKGEREILYGKHELLNLSTPEVPPNGRKHWEPDDLIPLPTFLQVRKGISSQEIEFEEFGLILVLDS